MADQVAEIKAKVDIAALIGERVTLKQRGRRFLGLCPFHSEKTPSFTVSPEIGIFKCFGCSVAGDAFTFLERYDGMTFVEALEHLAQRTGVKLERRVVDSRVAAMDKQILEANHLAAEYYHFLLTKHKVGKKASDYLRLRGVTKDSINQYLLGYSLQSWDGLLTFLTKKGYSPELLESAGLIINKSTHQRIKESKNYYDRFRGRLMFPLRDSRGQVIGFSGRVLNPTEKEAKYINSPETPVYHKGKHLFGVFENRVEIRREDRVVLVEGELDAISSWQAGVKNMCAVKGTALTEDQVKLVRRFTRNLTLALDSDGAGWEAIVRSLPILEGHGMNVRVALLPTGAKDPDECARENPKAWRELIRGALNVYDALIEGIIARTGRETGEQKKQASERLAPILARIENAVEQDHWVAKTAALLGVREDAMRRQMEADRRGISPRKPETESGHHVQGTRKKVRAEVLSRYLLALLIQAKATLPATLQEEWLQPIGVRKIIEALRPPAGQAISPPSQVFRDALAQELRDLYDDAALVTIGESPDVLADPQWVDREIVQTAAGLKQEWLREQLKQQGLSAEEVAALTSQLQRASIAELV